MVVKTWASLQLLHLAVQRHTKDHIVSVTVLFVLLRQPVKHQLTFATHLTCHTPVVHNTLELCLNTDNTYIEYMYEMRYEGNNMVCYKPRSVCPSKCENLPAWQVLYTASHHLPNGPAHSCKTCCLCGGVFPPLSGKMQLVLHLLQPMSWWILAAAAAAAKDSIHVSAILY